MEVPLSENQPTLSVFQSSDDDRENAGEPAVSHTVAPSLIPVSGTNDTGLSIDKRVPASEQFRCWVRLARTLAKNKRLPKDRRLICDLVADAVGMGRKSARAARRRP